MLKTYLFFLLTFLWSITTNAQIDNRGVSIEEIILKTDPPKFILKGHTDFIRCLSFSPDQEKLVSGADDAKIKLWNLKTGLCEKTFEEHTDFIQTITHSSDGKYIATAGNDYIINIINIQTNICKTFRGHISPVLCLTFSNDQKNLFSCASDATIRIWLLTNNMGICEKILKGHTGPIIRIKLSNNGKKIASYATDNSARIWDIQSGLCEKIYRSPIGSQIQDIIFTLDDSLLAAITTNNEISLYNISTNNYISLKGHEAWVNCVKFSPDGKKMASCSDDNVIKIWDTTTGKCLITLKGHTQQILCMTFDASGKTLATGSADKSIMIWNIP